MGARIIVFFCIFIALFACENEQAIIPENTMVDLLYEIHLSDGIIGNSYQNFRTSETKFEAYQKIFDKYHVNLADFDSSMVYYSANLEVFLAIYDSVITKLMKLETSVNAGLYFQPNLLSIDTLIQNTFPQDYPLKDSIYREFWTFERNDSLKGSEFADESFFWIDVDTLHGNKYVLKADLTLMPDSVNCTPFMQMEVNYADSTSGKQMLALKVDSLMHSYNLYFSLDSGKLPIRLNVYLINDTCSSGSKALIENIRLYELGDPDYIDTFRFHEFAKPE